MDTAKYQTIAKQISADLDALAKKYDLSSYGFIGFVGEPGKGHVPICTHAVAKPQFSEHLHIKVFRSVFLKAVQALGEVGGGMYKVSIE